MSETKQSKDFIEQRSKEYNEVAEYQKLNDYVWKDKVAREYKELIHRKKTKDVITNFQFNRNEDRIKNFKEENTEYFKAAAHSHVFLSDEFANAVSFWAKNLIVALASTADGKTTLGCNLAYRSISQAMRVCYITNEENPMDIMNRVAMMFKGKTYANHHKMPPDMVEYLNKAAGVLSPKLDIIHDSYNGASGQTTTIEGVSSILDSTLQSGNEYNLIIIDYYQNINSSTDNPTLDPYQVQERFSNYLDNFKNQSKCPIVVVAQRKPRKKDPKQELDYKEAIEGRKVIANKATCVLEVRADKENLRTFFTIRKTRFSESQGKTICMGFKGGRYVTYDDAFRVDVINRKRIEEEREITKNIMSSIEIGEN